VIDDEEKVYYANPAAMKIFGHEGLEKSKTQCGDFFSCTNRNRDPQGCGYSEDCTNCKILASIRNCLSESAETITEEGENLITRDDTHKSMWLKYKAQSLSMDDRRRVIIAVEDVTEIKQAAEAVRESEENLSITLHSIGDAVIATDKDGHITRMNEVAERLTGWPFTKARNKRLTEVFTIVNADSRKTVEDPVKIVLEKGRTVGLANHTVLISHDRNEYHIADSAAPIRDREGHTRGAIMVFSDITEKYRAQQKITSLAKFPGENPYPIFRISGDGALLYHNKASLSLLESHHVREGQYIPDTWRRAVENVLTSKTSREIEVALEDKVYSLVFLPVPESKYVNVYGYDITVRKKLETDLKNSNRIFNQALDMLCLAGFDGYFKVLNPSWSRTLGWSTEELLAKPWIEFVHPDDRAATARIKSVLAEGREIHQFENRYICKDGSITWLSWNSVPYPEENILIGVARDITERKVRDKNEKFI
jgi:PAS domain S-box-containing protein